MPRKLSMISGLPAIWGLAAAIVGLVLLLPLEAHAQKNFDQPPQMGTSTPNTRRNTRNTRFTLINDSSEIIDNLNISPASSESWGDDLFGTLALPPHNRVIVGPSQDTGCSFDIRVVYHDRREEVLRRQNLCDIQELAFTGRNARQPRERSNSDN